MTDKQNARYFFETLTYGSCSFVAPPALTPQAQQHFYQDAGSFLNAASLHFDLASVYQIPQCQRLK